MRMRTPWPLRGTLLVLGVLAESVDRLGGWVWGEQDEVGYLDQGGDSYYIT